MAYQGNLLSKTLVIGIIFLFVGISVVSSTGNINRTFSICISNNPPYEPSEPIPPDGAENWTGGGLCWTGGDPDDDDVEYDVYFGEYSPPPLIVCNWTSNCTEPTPLHTLARLKRYTTYYWKVVAWDKHGASTEGPIWSFTTELNYPPVPKIDCTSSDLWFKIVPPGQIVYAQIKVCNFGDELSFLNWHVDTTNVPTWGTWEFYPENGTNLLAPYCAIIDVEFIITEEGGDYTGTITVYNSDNSSDYCMVAVHGTVPRNKVTTYSLLQLLFDKLPFLEVFLRAINLLR